MRGVGDVQLDRQAAALPGDGADQLLAGHVHLLRGGGLRRPHRFSSTPRRACSPPGHTVGVLLGDRVQPALADDPGVAAVDHLART